MSGASKPVLLVVDDEPSIRDPLAEYLGGNGYEIKTAGRADAARSLIEEGGIDLVLLDIMMPGEDGLSLCRDLRAKGTLPVILLTARAEDTDRIVGLEIGADDYVTKPFNPRELLARVKAVLRRSKDSPSEPLTPGGTKFRIESFTLEIEGRRLLDAAGEEVKLTGGEYELLLALTERTGRVLNRDQLLDITQGRSAHVFDRSIDNQISRLRKKIEPDPKDPTIIKTVRGGGYVLAAKVTKE
ncbi:response regulator [Parvularcula marina]|uniref:Regulatory protein VirG n=1 Tax=Parvularcula marina TaxID=2292771 RepID=A0A371RHB8_9PROT|nr:response regulator transcription factor [Parvularcula marina]RFB04843.1 DNA-binding response regulator [Parvularcula marina]